MGTFCNSLLYHPSHSSSELSFLTVRFDAVSLKGVRERTPLPPPFGENLLFGPAAGDELREPYGLDCCCWREDIVELKKSPSLLSLAVVCEFLV